MLLQRERITVEIQFSLEYPEDKKGTTVDSQVFLLFTVSVFLANQKGSFVTHSIRSIGYIRK